MKFHYPDNKEVLHSNVLEHHVIASISPDLSKYVEAVPSHDPLMLTCLMDLNVEGNIRQVSMALFPASPAENMTEGPYKPPS